MSDLKITKTQRQSEAVTKPATVREAAPAALIKKPVMHEPLATPDSLVVNEAEILKSGPR